MSDNARAMVLASFIGDALALGPHWEYDPKILAQRFGPVTGYLKPLADSYHDGKNAGELTHYGDQTLVLLESLAARGGFDLDDFAARWRALFNGYSGYVDGATRMTLKIFDFGEGPTNSGSNSNDLAGAARVAPLVYALSGDLPQLVAAARAQTKMTHNHAQVIEAAEFFARAAWAILGGTKPEAALRLAGEAGYASAPIGQWLEMGLASADQDTVTAIAGFGQTCHIGEAMPGVIHLIARHGWDLSACLRENVMAGGDSAARGMLAGLIVGATVGLEGLPVAWMEGLAAKAAIEGDLQALAVA
ncbi:ADP-ribosylglycohydrolase family protein [Desulfovibrio aerotolerans]|uniref:ADP-ribosylglycohydrolase family protein n=1 Tax=Solidesulfovibrio aerotolerans TaxID=295255 RepID=A0A7C9N0D1_9BACT|nr:ADP-ribosylglycohydrolase family protein [Solidesulfovibrio aerotolerans]MYL83137.1 ADP-ribosylglycohydrolase family protein [Solidesulfovibrio aerotolerans]